MGEGLSSRALLILRVAAFDYGSVYGEMSLLQIMLVYKLHTHVYSLPGIRIPWDLEFRNLQEIEFHRRFSPEDRDEDFDFPFRAAGRGSLFRCTHKRR